MSILKPDKAVCNGEIGCPLIAPRKCPREDCGEEGDCESHDLDTSN